MNPAVAACLAGEISPQVALSRLLLGWADAAEITAAVVEATDPANAAWRALSALVAGREAELDRLSAEIRRIGSDHSRVGGVAGIAAFFDRAVLHSPEAGVALYSLGDPAILAAATTEIVDWLRAEALLASSARVLDLGCGIGRVAAALAPFCQEVVGLDVSPGMVTEARRRHPALRFEVSDGTALPPGPWDLVLLVDTMPYVLQAGLADAVVAGAFAALRPGGAVVVLNLSYGRDADADWADAARWAAPWGAELSCSRPFRLWDAAAFVFRAFPWKT
jgi:SAM-dependent methyltransferase